LASVIPPGVVLAPENPERPDSPEPRRRARPPAKATSDRFSSINAFVDDTMRDLSRAEALIWITLWRDTRDGVATTSYSRLEKRAGVNRSTVTRSLRSLRERGLVEVVRQGSQRRGASTYRVVAR
jgi:DNA-binding transcriptional ArsR family regulator